MQTDNSTQELQSDIDELNELLKQAKRPGVIAALQNDINILKKKLEPSSQKSKPTTQSPIPAPLKTETSKITAEPITISSYSWEQEGKFIKIYVEIEGIGNVPKEQIKVSFQDKSFEMEAPVNGKLYRFSISNLARAIKPSACSFRLRPKRIIFVLEKKEDGHWDSLQPKKDDLFKKKPNLSDNPEQGLMDMMKNLYESGDEEMKRTIAKAWSESRDKTGKGIDGL